MLCWTVMFSFFPSGSQQLLAEAGLVLHMALTVDMQDGGCNGRSQVKAKPQLVHDGLGER